MGGCFCGLASGMTNRFFCGVLNFTDFGRSFRADLLWGAFPGLKTWAVLFGHFMASVSAY